MSKEIILGAGTAGIITALFTGGRAIDPKPLGELNLPFSPGIRIFKWDVEVVQFISHWLAETYTEFKIEKKTLHICYRCEEEDWNGEESSQKILTEADENFKRDYSFITRGKKEYEQSFLSSGQNSISYVDINGLGYEGSYVFFFKSMLEYLRRKNRLIEKKISKVDFSTRSVTCDDGTRYNYSKCYSTIKLPLLCDLMGQPMKHSFEVNTKCFYSTTKSVDGGIKGFAYMYSTEGEFTRKTEFEKYYVYETVKPHEGDYFEVDNLIKDRFENIPLQIKNSLSIRDYFGIALVGRYAQWNHSIKANEIIHRFLEQRKLG